MDTRRKNSTKRRAILEALCSTNEHPSAEMLYEKLKTQIPDLSLGTVYRDLSVFCEEGSAAGVGVLDGRVRFDGRTDRHAHFMCRECGKIIDVDLPCVTDKILESVKTDYDVIPEDWSLNFKGLCRQCAAKEKSAEENSENPVPAAPTEKN